MFGNAPQPTPTFECICGQAIKEQCYICPIDDPCIETIIVVGNACIDKRTDESIKGRRLKSARPYIKTEVSIYVMTILK